MLGDLFTRTWNEDGLHKKLGNQLSHLPSIILKQLIWKLATGVLVMTM